MPLHLQPVDVSRDLDSVDSVLIVSCPVCPPVSLAIETKSPFIELLRSGLKTRAFQGHISGIREPLEKRGVRTDVLSMYVPVPTMCLWTRRQRKRLGKHAKDFESVLVLGCDSATHTVKRALDGTDCRILQGMRTTGITNATVRFQLPLTVILEEATQVGQVEKTDEETS